MPGVASLENFNESPFKIHRTFHSLSRRWPGGGGAQMEGEEEGGGGQLERAMRPA